MKPPVLLLFIMLSFTLITKAQTDIISTDDTTDTTKAQTEDYVITNKGDTIKCRIFSAFFSGHDMYKVEGKSKKIKTDEIQEYYISHKNLRQRAVFDGDKKRQNI